jgi:hypothetical protein
LLQPKPSTNWFCQHGFNSRIDVLSIHKTILSSIYRNLFKTSGTQKVVHKKHQIFMSLNTSCIPKIKYLKLVSPHHRNVRLPNAYQLPTPYFYCGSTHGSYRWVKIHWPFGIHPSLPCLKHLYTRCWLLEIIFSIACTLLLLRNVNFKFCKHSRGFASYHYR